MVFDNFKAAAIVPPTLKAPSVSVGASPASGAAPLAVTFSASASSPNGPIVSENWDFGDGQTGTGFNAAHTYTSVGNFTARVTVTDNLGMSASASAGATVSQPVS